MQDVQQQQWQYLQEKEKSFTERPVQILAPITTRLAILIAAFSGAMHHGMRRHQYSRSPS
jgi:hypothetical protein